MTKLKIKITKDIYEKAMYCGRGAPGPTTENCAIALAVRDIFPHAAVGGSFILFDGRCRKGTILEIVRQGKKLGAMLPKIAMGMIVQFDTSSPERRLTLPEFEFEIDVPDEVVDSINIEDVKILLQNHPNLELV